MDRAELGAGGFARGGGSTVVVGPLPHEDARCWPRMFLSYRAVSFCRRSILALWRGRFAVQAGARRRRGRAPAPCGGGDERCPPGRLAVPPRRFSQGFEHEPRGMGLRDGCIGNGRHPVPWLPAARDGKAASPVVTSRSKSDSTSRANTMPRRSARRRSSRNPRSRASCRNRQAHKAGDVLPGIGRRTSAQCRTCRCGTGNE
jgi:hypothetical protein